MPIFYTLFMLDRGVMLFCPHIEHKSIKDWAGNNQLMLQSFTRVIVVGLVLGVLQLCIWTYHILFAEL